MIRRKGQAARAADPDWRRLARHLPKLIMDALQVPRPGLADKAAYPVLARHRSLTVLDAPSLALAANPRAYQSLPALLW